MIKFIIDITIVYLMSNVLLFWIEIVRYFIRRKHISDILAAIDLYGGLFTFFVMLVYSVFLPGILLSLAMTARMDSEKERQSYKARIMD